MTKVRRRIEDRIADILDAIENIKADLGDIGREVFLHDGKTLRAIIEGIIVIGEAGRHIVELDPGMKTRDPELWQYLRDAYDMRIVLTHEYFRVDPGIVWTTVQVSIPRLERCLLDWRLRNRPP